MRPLKLTIKNFRSFSEKQTFYFPNRAGFYFMTGINEAEPRLGSNGSGKSSVWKALCWVCYGRTSEGLKAGDVANWGAGKDAQVELEYEHDGLIWVAVITWSPNSWVLYSQGGDTYDLIKNEENNLLQSHLSLSFEAFRHSVLMAQGAPMFLDLPKAEKESLFSTIMNLDRWLDYSAKASLKASSISKEIEECDISAAELRGRLRELQTTDYSEDIARWQKEHLDVVESYDAEHKEKSAKLAGVRNTRGASVRNKAALESQISTTRLTREPILSKLQELRREADALWDKENEHQAQIALLLEQDKHLKDDTCSACMQSIPAEYRMRQLASIKAIKTRLDGMVRSIHADISANTAESAKLEDELHAIDDSLVKLGEELRTASRAVSDADADIQTITDALLRLELNAEQELRRPNPFQNRQDDLSNSIAAAQQELDDAIQTKESAEQSLSYFQYWVRGFKEVRLYLIAEAVRQLEVEVNSSLSQLGLMDWSLRFDVDSENKNGKIRKGFAVMVLSPLNKSAVPWEVWSGGESQRLRIAAEQGLANLIRSSSGMTLNLEVWDEPTHWMSEQGVDDLLPSLASRAKDYDRQVWLVDHRTGGFGAFDGIATVLKTVSGSHIVQDESYERE